MILNKETAKKTAELLLQIKAIKLEPQQPFTWASGWKSPIYCDNRIILSYPMIRNYVREHFAKQIEEHYGKPDVIAAVATGAIGIGMLVAEYLSLPFAYVRPEPKGHGRKNQIEGNLEEGQSVIVIDRTEPQVPVDGRLDELERIDGRGVDGRAFVIQRRSGVHDLGDEVAASKRNVQAYAAAHRQCLVASFVSRSKRGIDHFVTKSVVTPYSQ